MYIYWIISYTYISPGTVSQHFQRLGDTRSLGWLLDKLPNGLSREWKCTQWTAKATWNINNGSTEYTFFGKVHQLMSADTNSSFHCEFALCGHAHIDGHSPGLGPGIKHCQLEPSCVWTSAMQGLWSQHVKRRVQTRFKHQHCTYKFHFWENNITDYHNKSRRFVLWILPQTFLLDMLRRCRG